MRFDDQRFTIIFNSCQCRVVNQYVSFIPVEVDDKRLERFGFQQPDYAIRIHPSTVMPIDRAVPAMIRAA